jgi:DsbC/DsbD-like thiol-disulfide interchange protein
VYNAFARSLKRLRVVITIDLRFSTKEKSRVDAQNRVSFEIDFDSKKKIVLDSKSEMKMKNATKKIPKRKKEEEEEEKKMKTTNSMMMTKETTSKFESCKSLSASSFKFKFLSSSTSDRFLVVSSKSR